MLRLSKVLAASFTLLFALVLLGNPLFAQPVPLIVKADVELIANNGSFEFDGSGPGMDLGSSSVLNLSGGNFTIHVWMMFSSLSNDGPCFGPDCDMSIVDKMVELNYDGWRLLKQSDNRFWFCLGGYGCEPGNMTTVIGKTVAITDRWYSVAVVKTSSKISIYVNGILEGITDLGDFVDSNAAALRIGANYDEYAYFSGKIAQVQLFRSALSGPIIRALFEQSKVRYGY